MPLLPPNAKRVELHTNSKVNEKIRRSTRKSIAIHREKSKGEIKERLKQLDREWDTERVLETNAAGIILVSTILGFTLNRSWFFLSGIISFFLLQHALQGWCPPLPIIRRLGVRTADEINIEKNALNNLLANSMLDKNPI